MPIKPLFAAAMLALFAASPVFACEQHKSHAIETTADAAPVIVMPEVTAVLPKSPVTEVKAMSIVPEPGEASGGYRGCGQQTVYLTN